MVQKSCGRIITFMSLALLCVIVLIGGNTFAASDFRQCANDDQIGSKNDGIIDQCEWITGAITQINSDYAESDGVPQRYIFTDPGTGSDCHTVVFRYDFTKSNVYTYDFMVDPDHTMPSSLLNHCGNLPPFTDIDTCQDALSNAFDVPVISDIFDQVPQREHPPSRNILLGCSPNPCTLVGTSVTSILHSNDLNPGNTTGDCFQNCGDSFAEVTVQYCEPANNDVVVMWFAGELAPASDPDGAGPAQGWGTNFGASSAPGASFDFRLVSIDGDASGARTNQLQNGLLEQSHNADLSVEKTCPGAVVKGNNVTYTINVTNNGPDSATMVFLDDTIPSGTTFVSASTSQGTCAAAPVGGVEHCDIGFMQPSDVVTVTIVVTVPTGIAGTQISNSATVGGSVIDPASGNNSDTCITFLITPTPPVDLSVTKTDDIDPIFAGNNLTYTIRVRNLTTTASPNGDATNVILTDSLPGGVILPPVSVTTTQGSCSVAANVVTCNLGTIDNCDDPAACDDDEVTVTIVVTVDPSTRGTITNVATVSGNQSDNNLLNNTFSEDTQVNGQVDLSVSKSCPGTADAGSQITYNVTVSNSGPSTSQNTHVEDFLPAGVTFISATPSQGTGCTFNLVDTVHCDLGSIAPSGSATVDITVLIDSGTSGNITNDAHIHVHNDEDSNSENDDDTCTTNVTITTQPTVDLSVTKTDSPDPVLAGQNLTYTVTVTNLSTTGATGVTLTDTLPVGVTYVSATPTQGSCSELNGVITCTIGALNASPGPGNTASVTIVVNVNPSVRGTITNTVIVAGNETDPNTGNNNDSENTQVNGQDNLSITKTDSSDPILVGQNLIYTVTVTNGGPSDSTNVQVVDTLPAGVSFVSAVASQGTGCSNIANTVTCQLGTIAPNQSATITITVLVNVVLPPGGSTIITNNVTVTSDENPQGSQTSEDTTVNAPIAVPSLNEWGMMMLMVLAAFLSIRFIRRRHS